MATKSKYIGKGLEVVFNIWNPFVFFSLGVEYVNFSEDSYKEFPEENYEGYAFTINFLFGSMEIVYDSRYPYLG